MSYTIGYRMPMRDRPRVRVRLVYGDDDKPTEASDRAWERMAGLPDGTVVEALEVFPAEDAGGKGGARTAAEPAEYHDVYVVWRRAVELALEETPSGLAYPSEDGGMSFGLPSNDAMSVLVTTDEEPPLSSLPSWAEDDAMASLPDGSVVECLWTDGGEVVGRRAYLMYGRALAMFYASGGSGGGGAS